MAYRTITYGASLLATREISGRPVVLLDRHAGIGDIICTFPSVRELRKRHPDAIFVYNTWPAFKGIVEMGRVADRVVAWDQSWMRRLVDSFYALRLDDERPSGRGFVHLVDDFARSLSTLNSVRASRGCTCLNLCPSR